MATNTITRRPGKPCFCCGSTRYWNFKGTNAVRCAACHPPAPAVDAEFFEVFDPQQSIITIDASRTGPGETAKIELKPIEVVDEVEKLRQRVAAGVEKLMKAWAEGKQIENDTEFAEFTNNFFKSRDKLDALCSELMAKGYNQCLWTKPPWPELWGARRGCNAWPEDIYPCCWVCPMNPHQYWDEKIAPINNKPVSHKSSKGDVIIEFLKTLGGLI